MAYSFRYYVRRIDGVLLYRNAVSAPNYSKLGNILGLFLEDGTFVSGMTEENSDVIDMKDYPNLTEPSDWIGGKYLFSEGKFKSNSGYVEPEPRFSDILQVINPDVSIDRGTFRDLFAFEERFKFDNFEECETVDQETFDAWVPNANPQVAALELPPLTSMLKRLVRTLKSDVDSHDNFRLGNPRVAAGFDLLIQCRFIQGTPLQLKRRKVEFLAGVAKEKNT